ncbi:MAG: response regulator transcription factor [Oscillospiraceae bacterium]|nr:response regulator transcription factor [Oscillospiraceae bacterium]
MYRILIVEDDAVIANAVQKHLVSWGYEARIAEDFENVLPAFAQYAPQLVRMDISLPFFNGYHWCSEIRKISKVPVIFITSMSDNINLVTAMNMGGDDFIAKPFDLAVLTVKVQAMLRRTYEFGGESTLLEHGGAILNISDGTLSVNGQKLELTKNEYKILHILMENRGKIVSRDALMEQLWQSDSYIDDNTLTVNMTRLRRKLEDAGLSDYITTKKGAGYLIA